MFYDNENQVLGSYGLSEEVKKRKIRPDDEEMISGPSPVHYDWLIGALLIMRKKKKCIVYNSTSDGFRYITL